MKNLIKAAIVGATGYAGQELLRLLLRHPEVEVVSIGSRTYDGQKMEDVYPLYKHVTKDICKNRTIEELSSIADVIFLALPHGVASGKINDQILDKCKIIDLGADFRLKDLDIYEKWYKTEHHGRSLINKSVYGLCELHRDEIKKAQLIGNPGCYTTCSILSLAPLVKNHLIQKDSIIIDAKSGVTGAGRNAQLLYMFCECTESVKPYKVGCHRHTPEIEQELSLLNGESLKVLFTPNLVPMNRGISALCYATLNDAGKKYSENELNALYHDFYKDEYFIRILDDRIPDTKWVKGSNFCDIAIKVDHRTNRAIVIGAIDNLFKGAAGQAIQNMNIMFGLPEKTGIDLITDYPV